MQSILKQTILTALYENKETTHLGIQDFIERSQEFHISTPPQKGRFEIGFTSFDSIAGCLQQEIIKFSCAALESIREIVRLTPYQKDSAWASIKLYYSSYYAANALMRFTGAGSTNLEKRHTSRVNQLATNLGVPGSEPEKGTYYFEIEMPSRTIIFQAVQSNDGAHGKFWKAFQQFLINLDTRIINSIGLQVDKDEASNYIAQIKKILERNSFNNGNWLSKVRNDINYKFDHSLWPPNQNRSPKLPKRLNEIVSLISSTASPVASISSDDILAFVDGCLLLNRFCKEYFLILSSANKKKKYFINKYPLPILEELTSAQASK